MSESHAAFDSRATSSDRTPSAWWIDGAGPLSSAAIFWLGCALLLMTIGLVTVYSASFYRALVTNKGEFFFLKQQAIGAAHTGTGK